MIFWAASATRVVRKWVTTLRSAKVAVVVVSSVGMRDACGYLSVRWLRVKCECDGPVKLNLAGFMPTYG